MSCYVEFEIFILWTRFNAHTFIVFISPAFAVQADCIVEQNFFFRNKYITAGNHGNKSFDGP
jgi:hypothetical protein